MMNKFKKVSVLFILLLAFVLYSSIGAKAIEWGEIQIDDAVGGVGGELYVNINMTSGGSPIGDTALTMSFDPYVIEFVRGTNATAEYGTVTVMAAGDGEETSLEYYVVFRGLVEGTSHLSLVQFMTWTYAGEALYANFNYGTITIGPEGTEATGPRGAVAGDDEPFEGAPTGDSAIFQIQGSDFTIFDHFSDAMVPAGFTRDQFEVRNSLHNGIRHNASGRVFMYMVTGTNDPILALLDEAAATFSAVEIRSQGGERFIIVVDPGPNIPVPSGFHMMTNLEFGGTLFHAWQCEENPEFNLVYAISSSGWEGLYLYDDLDETFQRFMGPIVEAGEEEEDEAEEPTDLVGRIVSIIQDNIVIVLAAVLIVIFLLLIIIIVLSVKVQRRNNELDELYAEGHGSFDENRDDDYDDYEDDEFEDDYDDDYEDDRYHDNGYEEAGYDEVGYDEADYETVVNYEDDDYDDYDDDDYDDDYDDEEDDERKDDFNIDFVDL